MGATSRVASSKVALSNVRMEEEEAPAEEKKDSVEGQRTVIIYSDGPQSTNMSVSIRPSLSAIHCAGCSPMLLPNKSSRLPNTQNYFQCGP